MDHRLIGLVDAQAREHALRVALEALLCDVEQKPETSFFVKQRTVELLESAGYEYSPAATTWEYTVSCALGGIIDSDAECADSELAEDIAWELLTDELTDIVLRRPEELINFFHIDIRPMD